MLKRQQSSSGLMEDPNFREHPGSRYGHKGVSSTLITKALQYDPDPPARLFERFGVLVNPFPSSSQTANNPHYRLLVDDDAETRIVSFLRDGKSQVVVIEGTQGVGKTNFLNLWLCATVAGEGVYGTPNTPDPIEFAPVALQQFKDLDPAYRRIFQGPGSACSMRPRSSPMNHLQRALL